jgi:lactoylglutathione lyase
MLRIKDPKLTLDYYQTHFKMVLIAQKHFPQWKFSLFFLASVPDGFTLPYEDTESDEAFKYLNQIDYTVLELTHNHGTESDPDFKHHNGNSDPRGFGHIGFIVDDVD